MSEVARREKKAGGAFPEADLTERDIRELLGAGKDIGELIKKVPTEKFQEFLDKLSKEKGLTRRKFTKETIEKIIAVAAGTGISAAVLYELFREKGQKSKETTAEETTLEIEKTTAEIEKEFDIEKASGIELFEKLAEYPEAIEKSRKQSLDKFAEDLAKKDFDNLILGRSYGSAATNAEAAYFLEQLLKNGRKISAIGLENLSYTFPEHVEATKKFNKGKLSPREMYGLTEVQDIAVPLLELAIKHSIEIVGLEPELLADVSRITAHKELPRFGQISERVGEVAKEKKEKGIVVTYVLEGNVTVDSWENEKLLHELAGEKIPYPPKEEVLKNNYTIKEYLKKIGLNPVAIQIEDWRWVTERLDAVLFKKFGGVLGKRIKPEDVNPEDLKKAKEIWKKFILKEKEPFVVQYPKGEENTFAMIIPGKVPEVPSSLP